MDAERIIDDALFDLSLDEPDPDYEHLMAFYLANVFFEPEEHDEDWREQEHINDYNRKASEESQWFLTCDAMRESQGFVSLPLPPFDDTTASGWMTEEDAIAEEREWRDRVHG